MMNNKLFIYNTLSRKKELFVPLHPPHVGLYSCGPTVYSEMHLGNLRTFAAFDVLFRYLTHLGYKVRYVRNITDAGHLTDDSGAGVDRIEESAKLEMLEPMEIVQKYTNNFHEVCAEFNLIPPSIEPTATGHIVEQIDLVKKIIDQGYGYLVKGSVYFDVRKYMEKFPYGELSGKVVDDLLQNTRELDGQDEKRNPSDFAIWKSVSPIHLQRWNSPWGEGIPGWHLECSAMSKKYLGKQFDIHGGGMDLKFPHHECEIAQSIGAYGVAPVRYWIHTNMLTVNGEKMSKSKGNSFLPRELFSGSHPMLEKGYAPMAVRFFMEQSHYGSTLDFTNEALQASERGYTKLMNSISVLDSIPVSEKSDSDIPKLCADCYAAMNDDLNTPILIAHLFEGVRIINSVKAGTEKISESDKSLLQKTIHDFVFDILGLHPEKSSDDNLTGELIQMILAQRNEAKARKDYSASDKIRQDLEKIGVKIKDGKDGTEFSIEK